jgi:hypothetical protein
VSAFQVSTEAGRTIVDWSVDGRRMAQVAYPQAALPAAQNAVVVLYDAGGNAAARYDAATRRFSRPGEVGPFSVTDVDYDEYQNACGDGVVALTASVSAVALAASRGQKDVVLGLLPGVYASWQMVSNNCSWLIAVLWYQFMVEFSNPHVQIGWK